MQANSAVGGTRFWNAQATHCLAVFVNTFFACLNTFLDIASSHGCCPCNRRELSVRIGAVCVRRRTSRRYSLARVSGHSVSRCTAMSPQASVYTHDAFTIVSGGQYQPVPWFTPKHVLGESRYRLRCIGRPQGCMVESINLINLTRGLLHYWWCYSYRETKKTPIHESVVLKVVCCIYIWHSKHL